MADSSESPKVPSPESRDSAEVVRCLEAAREMWELAQLKEAVRWVQRGAEAAEQDGNDMRALALARAGADLSAYARAHAPAGEAAPNSAVAGTPAPAGTVSGGSTVPRPRVSQPPPLPDEAAGDIDVPITADAPESAKIEKADAATNPSDAAGKPPAEKSAPEKTTAAEKPAATLNDKPTASTPPVASNGTPLGSFPSTPSRPPIADRPSVRPSARAPQAPVARTPGASVSPKPAATAPSVAPANPASNGASLASLAGVSVSELLASGRAERVTVKRSVLDGGVLVVRSAQGAKTSPGARQAVLVYVDGDDVG